jgi:hypothetical protein
MHAILGEITFGGECSPPTKEEARAKADGKALPGFFLCIFSSLACLRKPVFSKRDPVWCKVPAILLLFLKSEKISALLYVGKAPEYRPLHDFRPLPEVLAYRPRAQISNHRRACTQAFSYT